MREMSDKVLVRHERDFNRIYQQAKHRAWFITENIAPALGASYGVIAILPGQSEAEEFSPPLCMNWRTRCWNMPNVATRPRPRQDGKRVYQPASITFVGGKCRWTEHRNRIRRLHPPARASPRQCFLTVRELGSHSPADLSRHSSRNAAVLNLETMPDAEPAQVAHADPPAHRREGRRISAQSLSFHRESVLSGPCRGGSGRVRPPRPSGKFPSHIMGNRTKRPHAQRPGR